MPEHAAPFVWLVGCLFVGCCFVVGFFFFSRECPNFSSRAPRPAPGLSGPISAHARGERRGTDASPSLKFALIIVKIFYKIIFGGSVGRGRAASEGREGREGKPAGAAPRQAAASALRYPGNSAPTAPSRPGAAQGRLRVRPVPGQAQEVPPSPPRSAKPTSPGEAVRRHGGTRIEAGITFLEFLFCSVLPR